MPQQALVCSLSLYTEINPYFLGLGFNNFFFLSLYSYLGSFLLYDLKRCSLGKGDVFKCVVLISFHCLTFGRFVLMLLLGLQMCPKIVPTLLLGKGYVCSTFVHNL